MKIIRLESVDSTNSWIARHETELDSPALVYCLDQTAGRGQRGNSWESERGKNITASLLFHPDGLEALSQFKISESIALAILEYLRGKGVEAKIKWPNDIYVDEKKICGILVEHVVTGKQITRTIAGFGLNLNQKTFYSDAPNPVSLAQITGEAYSLEKEVEEISVILEETLRENFLSDCIHEEFMKNLWRNDGRCHRFNDRKNGELIEAAIDDISKIGMLTLKLKDGENREYAFKEVEFLL